MRNVVLMALGALVLGSAAGAAPNGPYPAGWVHDGDVVEMRGPWRRTGPAPERTKTVADAESVADAEFVTDQDCRPRVKEVLCLVEGAHGDRLLDRSCLPETARYAPPFEALYDRLPPVMQKMFCSLERIYLEKELTSTAYALRGAAVLGIRASLLDEKLSLHHWATWKEQLSFGGSPGSYETADGLPAYEGESPDGEDNFLYSVMVHEFAHLFDFANGVNATEGFGGDLKAGSFGSISWESLAKPKAGNEFAHRKGLCVYRCNGKTLAPEAAVALYGELYGKTSFLNTYTAKSAYEDFADTFSFYWLFRASRISYRLTTGHGESYDLREVLASDRLRPKVRYIEEFLRRPAIRYP